MLQLPNRKKGETVVTVTRAAFGREELDGEPAADDRDLTLTSYRTRQLNGEDANCEDFDNFRKARDGVIPPVDGDIDR